VKSAKAPALSAAEVRAALAAAASPAKARVMAGFFKTGKGQYGEGDQFWGVTVPAQRKIARAHRGLPLGELGRLLDSKVHEARLTALLILVDRYARGDDDTKRAAFDFYLRHLGRVNNWDLVDSSAHQIVGEHLKARDRALLDRLAKSKVLWERRVAMISTYAFINAGEHEDTFRLAKALMRDDEDLMHKAVGWMLREVGKRIDPELLRGFLRAHASDLPRTALRYAIEHFDPTERRAWLAK
jgi:3-methyladenine DNA glycosylase AlkD